MMGITPLFLLLFLASLLTGCAGNPQQTQELSGKLSISGSTALKPLVDVAAKEFMRQHPQVKITVDGGGSKKGLKNVNNKVSDIGDSDIYVDPALYPDPNMTDHIICVTPFVMIVNPGVKVTSLSKEQLIDILSSGKITNWNQIPGGNDQPIHPVVRPSTSGTRETFRKYVLGGADELVGTPLNVDDTNAVVNKVATTPGAIGYIGLSALKPTVKTVALDNFTPTAQTIGDGKYNFWSYEHMYTLGDNTPLLTEFLAFMTSPAMQKKAHDLSYITIDEMNLPKVGSLPGEQLDQPALAFSSSYESEVNRRESYN
ncbi:phosphate-binding protein [Dictyobacter alpinus]|uniref:Phosphate-binding protein n=2 Tax=Dictyobacter alpinus TaxID=2014873 RepID=A0A402B3R9_9CHLR|nr:phosphate-binding protein [Dictyobacter alpinus]